MTGHLVSPSEWFAERSLYESEVLSFCVSVDRAILVVDYIWDYEIRPRGSRKFWLLEFIDVLSFRQTETRAYGTFTGEYHVPGGSNAVPEVSFDEVFMLPDAGYKMTLCIMRLGCFEFDFTDLRVTKREARAARRGDDWDYLDIETGESVDIWRPFGDVC
jgi:hypothetical protein